MDRLRWFLIPLLTCSVVLTCSGLQGAPPWGALFPFQRVEADPKKHYALGEEHGPWLILCHTFSGESGRQEAHRLALELRRDFQLEAFVHMQRYDYTKQEEGLGFSRYSTATELKRKRMRYLKNVAIDEYAVMVGHFKSVEDPALQPTLHTIKFALPKCLEKKRPSLDVQDDGAAIVDVREVRRFLVAVSEKVTGAVQKVGPMGNAFATRNPLLPEEEEAPEIDPLVLEMNQEVEHSLLKCPGKYTVRVATFRGRTTIDQGEIRRLEMGAAQLESRLEEAASKANRLTTALRKMGVEAYEFHDRIESIVCVGSFESVGTPRADGKMELNPAVLELMKRFGASAQNVVDGQSQSLDGLKPKGMAGISYDVQPWPVQVPKTPAAAAAFGIGIFR